MLDGVRITFPYLAPWVDSTYGEQSGLWMDSHRIDSQRGVQQGDPLGLLLFSFALIPWGLMLIETSANPKQFHLPWTLVLLIEVACRN